MVRIGEWKSKSKMRDKERRKQRKDDTGKQEMTRDKRGEKKKNTTQKWQWKARMKHERREEKP